MNRRTFFRRLCFAAALPFVPLPPLGPQSPRLLAQRRGPISPFVYDEPGRVTHPNPEYINAPYEIAFFFQSPYCGGETIKAAYPPRFRTAEDAQYFMSKIV